MTLRGVAIFLILGSLSLQGQTAEAHIASSSSSSNQKIEIREEKFGTPDLSSKELVQLRQGVLDSLPKYFSTSSPQKNPTSSPCGSEKSSSLVRSLLNSAKPGAFPEDEGKRLCIMEYVGSKKLLILSDI